MSAPHETFQQMPDEAIESIFFNAMTSALHNGPEDALFPYFLGVARNHKDHFETISRQRGKFRARAEYIRIMVDIFQYESVVR